MQFCIFRLFNQTLIMADRWVKHSVNLTRKLSTCSTTTGSRNRFGQPKALCFTLLAQYSPCGQVLTSTCSRERCISKLKPPHCIISRQYSNKTLYSVESSATGFNDYEAERKNFRLSAPEYFNFATDVIDRWAMTEKVSTLYIDI